MLSKFQSWCRGTVLLALWFRTGGTLRVCALAPASSLVPGISSCPHHAAVVGASSAALAATAVMVAVGASSTKKIAGEQSYFLVLLAEYLLYAQDPCQKAGELHTLSDC